MLGISSLMICDWRALTAVLGWFGQPKASSLPPCTPAGREGECRPVLLPVRLHRAQEQWGERLPGPVCQLRSGARPSCLGICAEISASFREMGHGREYRLLCPEHPALHFLPVKQHSMSPHTTAAMGVEPLIEAFKEAGDDYSYIMMEALADRLAEAFAEKLHAIVRQELWGYAPDEDLNVDDLLKVKYQVRETGPPQGGCAVGE